jgi:hypothetical protein
MALAASSAPMRDADRRFASDRSQRRNRAVQSGSVMATRRTRSAYRASRSEPFS